MKKFNSALLVCISLLLFAACKKDSGGNGSNYYIKANIDGTEKTYATYPLVVKLDAGGSYSLGLSGSADGSSGEGLGLQINQTGAPITAGTYTDGAGGATYAVAGTYNPGTTDLAAIFGAGIQLSSTSPLTIVINSISDSNVSGTFSGEYFDNSGSGSNSIFITNGEFNLPIQ